MPHRVRVTQGDALFERRASVAQDEFRNPPHAGNAIGIAQPDFGAIFLLAKPKIHRRNGITALRNGEIRFDPHRHPRPTRSYFGLFDRLVRAKNRTPIALIRAVAEVAAEIGEEAATQIFVFQVEAPPRLRLTRLRQIRAARIRMIKRSLDRARRSSG